MTAYKLFGLGSVLDAAGFTVAYNFDAAALVLPQCIVTWNKGNYIVAYNGDTRNIPTDIEVLHFIRKLGEFRTYTIQVEARVTVFVDHEIDEDTLMSLEPEFSINPSTVKIIKEELSYGVHGT
jgi:hypothetical protein